MLISIHKYRLLVWEIRLSYEAHEQAQADEIIDWCAERRIYLRPEKESLTIRRLGGRFFSSKNAVEFKLRWK